jgi:hypothetical protein
MLEWESWNGGTRMNRYVVKVDEERRKYLEMLEERGER